MAKVPGVPTLEPVAQPTMSPQEAGKVGQSISQMGDVGQDLTQEQAGLSLFMKKAQQNEMIEQAGTEEAALQRYYGKIAAFGGTMSGIGSFLNGVSSAASAYTKGTFNPSATPASGGTSGGGSYDSGD